MAHGKYAVMQAAEILALPAAPQAEVKRRVLSEFLQNPFLDDDVQTLALRTRVSRSETAEVLAGLCEEGLLQEAGQRGYMLDLEQLGEAAAAGKVISLPAEALIAQQTKPPETPDLSSQENPESAAFGVILMRKDGTAELVDEQAAAWLEIPATDLDAAAFESVTGVDPGLVLGGALRTSFCLQQPRPLVITVHACFLGCEPGVLIVLQDKSLHEEMARVHAHAQEELFDRLRGEVVEPMLLIQQFLENPTPEDLGQARAALEQVNGFLEAFMLGGRADLPEAS